MRNVASQNAFQQTIQEVRDAADHDADVPRKRQKIRKAKMSDSSIAGEVVDVTLEFSGRQQASQMLFGCRGSPLYVRADPDSLGFIQHAMQANFIANVPKPAKKSNTGGNDDEDEEDEESEDDDEVHE